MNMKKLYVGSIIGLLLSASQVYAGQIYNPPNYMLAPAIVTGSSLLSLTAISTYPQQSFSIGGGGFVAAQNDGTPMLTGNYIGHYDFSGTIGTTGALQRGASIVGVASENWTATADGTTMLFEMNAPGSNYLTTVITVNATGLSAGTVAVSGNETVTGTITASGAVSGGNASGTSNLVPLNQLKAGTTASVTPLPAAGVGVVTTITGGTPLRWVLEFTCIVADDGYAVNDIIINPQLWNLTLFLPNITFANYSTIGFPPPLTGYVFYAPNKTTGVNASLTLANWSYRWSYARI